MLARSGEPLLRVVSYNIHKGLDRSNRRLTLAAIADGLHRLAPDLVLLQEVVGAHARLERRFGDWPRAPQVEVLATRLGAYFVYAPNAVRAGGDHGNAMLSRYPITHWENFDISVSRLERRGLLHAVVAVPGIVGGLHVACTHLNLLHGERRRQIAAVSARLGALVPRPAPLVLGGDFNDWRLWATHRLQRDAGLREAHVSHTGRHPRTFPGWRPMLALDRIYVRGFAVRDAHVLAGPAWRDLSDHLGVQADLCLRHLAG